MDSCFSRNILGNWRRWSDASERLALWNKSCTAVIFHGGSLNLPPHWSQQLSSWTRPWKVAKCCSRHSQLQPSHSALGLAARRLLKIRSLSAVDYFHLWCHHFPDSCIVPTPLNRFWQRDSVFPADGQLWCLLFEIISINLRPGWGVSNSRAELDTRTLAGSDETHLLTTTTLGHLRQWYILLQVVLCIPGTITHLQPWGRLTRVPDPPTHLTYPSNQSWTDGKPPWADRYPFTVDTIEKPGNACIAKNVKVQTIYADCRHCIQLKGQCLNSLHKSLTLRSKTILNTKMSTCDV